MKNKKTNPTVSKFSVLRQICNLIPPHLVPKLAREAGADKHARSFSTWSHVVALLHSQLSHSISLNDVCDSLSLQSGPLSALRGATPPSRNGLSHANKVRSADMAEKLFWAVLDALGRLSPGFAKGRAPKHARRFKTPIHVIDSTTIELIANCLGWAQHRRRKAAAKAHMRLNLQSLLPQCVIVGTANDHDNARARELCAGVKSGEIVIFDRGYIDFEHLRELDGRGVNWVTRAKENMAYKVIEERDCKGDEKILADQVIQLKGRKFAKMGSLRRVEAMVEVDGKERRMVFLTNQQTWSPRSVADLYRCRWEIEVFFKQMKQGLQLADFLGNSLNAVRWQIWSALLVNLLLRFLSFVSGWAHSFMRLFTVVRALQWRRLDLLELLRRYGTAGGHYRQLAQPEQAYFPGF